MPVYKTARLEQYREEYLRVADDIFNRTAHFLPDVQLERHPGRFSILSREPRDRAAKIVIYQDRLEWTKDWPRMSEGVYAWVRANGPVGDATWDDIMPVELPHIFTRMDRNDTVQIAANPQADFAYSQLWQARTTRNWHASSPRVPKLHRPTLKWHNACRGGEGQYYWV
jgi:hypothetical protein